MPTDDNWGAPGTTAELLRQRLDGALPLEHIIVDSLLDTLQGFRRELLPLSGKPLGDLVLAPTTDMVVLQTIKDHGKQLASRTGGMESERDTGLAIYFAAIASALVFHEQKISTHSYQSLANSFATLAGKAWMSPKLADLFRRAGVICQQ